MSVVGFDVGNESCIVAVARQRGIDVVLNDESKRETPAVVCFGEKQRFIGTAGATSSTMNPKNSVSQIKRLVGRKFSDPQVQRDIQLVPFKVTEGPDGFPLIHANYLGEQKTFTPTQILAMVLSNLKSIAENNLNAAVIDCCIGVPVYFNDLQRRAVIDAATIAGLRPLRLFHETTATALAYGIYKTDLPENDQLNVAFVDVGHASMQVCIAGYKKGQLKILAHSYDQSLGGRDFDEVLFKHFAAKFKDEYKIDVYQNARACIRLRTGCEKLKKMLSANPEAPLNIECLMDDKDVRGFIKREDFEQISVPILERVKQPLEKALSEAGLSLENIHSVEVVGSGSRVPAIIRILTEFFGKEPRRTMNAIPVSAAPEPPKESTKMDTDEAVNEASKTETDVNMEDAKSASNSSAGGVDNGVPESNDKPVEMETDSKKVKKTNVPVVELVYGGMSAEELQKAVEKEFEMALQDRVMEETKDKKNAVEAYVYDMRNKLGNPIEVRYKECTERGPAIAQIAYCINSFRGAALSKDPKFDHIDMAEKQKVVSECSDAEAWMREKQQQQEGLPKFATPVLLSADIKRKTEALDRFCKPIMTRPPPPKPQTAPAATPGEQPQAAEQQKPGANASGEPVADEGSQVSPAAAPEPMDTDKSGSGPAA
ncbi:hypothetical protein B296_00025009 [Ensete ventricosum]|uniref:Heat shock 70 kDa protein 14 n=1 Tax=Ensete ventricosum TaxID=4639 RepID=A0A427ATY0_ENSVE|nr:hypothetical protein B296_00025009 [Ensete ventricosum]